MRIYKYFISIFCLFLFVDGFSQKQKTDSIPTQVKDTLVYKSPYGLRLGIDLSKPILGMVSNSYSGLEFVGDYRISKRFFIAAEIGFEEETTAEDFTNSTTKGNYARVGFNFNAYENWLDMNNEIILGLRYGFSNFDQTLNSYTPNTNNTYFLANTNTTPITTNNLTAHWSEFLVGFKVETFKNMFVSFSASYKVLIHADEPNNFKTLYAPGFNTIYESNTGFGFNYSLSYLIPFSKK